MKKEAKKEQKKSPCRRHGLFFVYRLGAPKSRIISAYNSGRESTPIVCDISAIDAPITERYSFILFSPIIIHRLISIISIKHAIVNTPCAKI